MCCNDLPEEILQKRKQIDSIDKQLLELISQRAQVVKSVGVIKKEHGLTDFYRPEREKQQLDNLKNINKNSVLPDDIIARLFKEIISACFTLEQSTVVAYAKNFADLSKKAIFKQFGGFVKDLSAEDIDQVFRMIVDDRCNYAVFPIENYQDGLFNAVLLNIARHELNICGEIYVDDENCNRARFWVVGKNKINPCANDKTTLLIIIENKLINLMDLLKPIYQSQINITKIQSVFDRMFFVDVLGHQNQEKVKKLIEELQKIAQIKVLGSYPNEQVL